MDRCPALSEACRIVSAGCSAMPWTSSVPAEASPAGFLRPRTSWSRSAGRRRSSTRSGGWSGSPRSCAASWTPTRRASSGSASTSSWPTGAPPGLSTSRRRAAWRQRAARSPTSSPTRPRAPRSSPPPSPTPSWRRLSAAASRSPLPRSGRSSSTSCTRSFRRHGSAA